MLQRSVDYTVSCNGDKKMVAFDFLSAPVKGSFIIPVWEVLFFVAVVCVCALLGKTTSCILNTYAFTFYWGFVSLLPTTFSLDGASHIALVVYVICGVAIYALFALSSLSATIKPKQPGEGSNLVPSMSPGGA